MFDMWVRIKGMQGSFDRSHRDHGGRGRSGGTLPFPETGDICFDHVTFTYPETDSPALATCPLRSRAAAPSP